jgi:hypothetical protein
MPMRRQFTQINEGQRQCPWLTAVAGDADPDRAAALSHISAENANSAAIRIIVMGKSHLTSGLVRSICLASFDKRMMHLPFSLPNA